MHKLLEGKKHRNVYVKQIGHISVLQKHRKGKSSSACAPKKGNLINIHCTNRFAPLTDHCPQSFGNTCILQQNNHTDDSIVHKKGAKFSGAGRLANVGSTAKNGVITDEKLKNVTNSVLRPNYKTKKGQHDKV